MTFPKISLLALFLLLTLNACAGGKLPDGRTEQEKRQEQFGKLFGDELLVFGSSNDPQNEQVTSFSSTPNISPLLWLASLKVIGDLPLIQADKSSGIILSDWYQIPQHPQEQFKVDIAITSSILRSDGISVNVFQKTQKNNLWQQEKLPENIAQAIEDTILNEARKLRSQSQ